MAEEREDGLGMDGVRASTIDADGGRSALVDVAVCCSSSVSACVRECGPTRGSEWLMLSVVAGVPLSCGEGKVRDAFNVVVAVWWRRRARLLVAVWPKLLEKSCFTEGDDVKPRIVCDSGPLPASSCLLFAKVCVFTSCRLFF